MAATTVALATQSSIPGPQSIHEKTYHFSAMEPTIVSCAAALQGTRHRTTRKRKPDEVDLEMDAALSRIPTDALGPFWFYKSSSFVIDGHMTHVGLKQQEKLELSELLRIGFIDQNFLKTKLVPLNDESSPVPRLRMYNWAVTNYAKGKGITTTVKDKHGNTRLIDPSISYDSALRRLHRTLFDPYRRGTLLFYKVDGDVHHTTVGQLLFIKWCMDNGVDTFVETHQDDIRTHLNETTKARAAKGSGRVKELTTAKFTHARLAGLQKMEVE